jgi:hypothetical protein
MLADNEVKKPERSGPIALPIAHELLGKGTHKTAGARRAEDRAVKV